MSTCVGDLDHSLIPPSETLLHSDHQFRVFLTKQTTSTIGFRWEFVEPFRDKFDIFKVEKCFGCRRNQWEVVHWSTAWSVMVRNLEQNLCYSFRIFVLRQREEDGNIVYLKKSKIFKSFTLPDVPSTMAVFRAVRKGQLAMVRRMLSVKPHLVNVPVNGESLLYQAVRTENLDMIELLLDFGAEVNLGVPGNGQTPVQLAVYNKNLKIVRYLMDHGADLNVVNCIGMNAGHYAVDSNDVNMLRYVLTHGCSTEARDRCHWTLIFRAIFGHASQEVVKYLLDKKCRLKVRDKNQLMPIDYAQLSGQEEVIKLIKRKLKI
ncbi:putative ankyrin repeat protein RF_0381 [Uranotaenia lowii]|uniref:putative ankyrin repeat protein RF_0381 n=1 Tax=Uranotaenia lowii TaxID=190385 RepID=UPI002478C1C5|nr:putative ankyrin repeat protein RF_0381 [Uranotaenia lowii]